jgi:hypothetical protein
VCCVRMLRIKGPRTIASQLAFYLCGACRTND